MRAVKNTERGIEARDVADPDGDGVVVEVRAVGICGSDLHLVALGPSPVTLGHEFAGVLGDGRPVAVKPNRHCGRCGPCGRGDHHLCRDAYGLMYGVGVDGGMAERVVVDEANVIPLPAALPFEALALVEPISIGVHAVHRSAVESGMRVLVVGAGSIGLTVVMALRWAGVETDIAARHAHQAAAADGLGARLSVADDYDVVFDSIGSQQALDDSLARVRAGGTVVEVGGWWSGVTVGMRAMTNEVTLVPAIFSNHRHGTSEFDQAAAVIAANPDAAELLVTHRFPLERAAEAFAAAGDRSGQRAIKVQLHP